MGREWTMKSFQSGNSIALRVPASVGMTAGEEWRLVEDGDGYRLERAERPKRKFNIGKVAGSATGLNYVRTGDRVFDDRTLHWAGGTME
ncbi:hypothetical protein [Sphingomonas jatrophae]|uniref:Antitoxin VapB n=1 Tax=Sphingomonas jatrophae TaxID=1166337 RepID=A0A1I6JZL3_9SPHN|nr:hypothetical protein [Sphingomonas jatrophae]SFR83970.1 antitoxin VapB [Sphingomonas jatrophae]